MALSTNNAPNDENLITLPGLSNSSFTQKVQTFALGDQVPGVFTVGASGQIDIDFLFDSGSLSGEVGVFSLSGMDELEVGSTAFIEEAVRRALSGSDLGHVLLSDINAAARFSGKLENIDYNRGEYAGVRSIRMLPGERVGLILSPLRSFQEYLERPHNTLLGPFFSFPNGNVNNTVHLTQVTPNLFAWEERRLSSISETRDFNDIIFQVEGISGNLTPIEEVIDPNEDWRSLPIGQVLINRNYSG